MVTYDIVPELESYLLSISKRLHSSLDENEESVAKKMSRLNRGITSDEEDEEEDEKDQEERGRSRKRPKKNVNANNKQKDG